MRRAAALVLAASATALAALAALAVLPSGASAAPRLLRVAADGTGEYRTLQSAIDAVPAGNRGPVTILVAEGTYREVVSVPAGKPHIRVLGATGAPEDVIITYDNAAGTPMPGGGTYGTAGSATVTVAADDFTADGISIVNAFDAAANPGVAAQAVALRTVGDRIALYHVRLLGHQDTGYLDAPTTADTDRVYLRDSTIAGTVDFIFGGAVAVFDHDTIDGLDRGSSTTNGYVTAASTQLRQRYGFLFTGCTFTSTARQATYYLGRPWHHSGDPLAIAQVVVRDSWLGAHIKDEPWTDMSGWSWVAARFDEYRNAGPGAGTGLFRPHLSNRDAVGYTAAAYLTGTDGWMPWTYHRQAKGNTP
jgi:pectin methylesterase-like acyl-CoA thioesterase